MYRSFFCFKNIARLFVFVLAVPLFLACSRDPGAKPVTAATAPIAPPPPPAPVPAPSPPVAPQAAVTDDNAKTSSPGANANPGGSEPGDTTSNVAVPSPTNIPSNSTLGEGLVNNAPVPVPVPPTQSPKVLPAVPTEPAPAPTRPAQETPPPPPPPVAVYPPLPPALLPPPPSPAPVPPLPTKPIKPVDNSRVAILFNTMLDPKLDGDAVENVTGRLLAEVLNEPDRVPEKVLRIEFLVAERYSEHKFPFESARRVRLLEKYINRRNYERNLVEAGLDTAVALNVNAALAVFGGYGGGVYSIKRLGAKADTMLTRLFSRGAKVAAEDAAKDTAKDASLDVPFSARTEANIFASFDEAFRVIPVKSRLATSLIALQLDPAEVDLIQDSLRTVLTVDAKRLPLSPTNLRTLRAAAVQIENSTPEKFGYFVFRLDSPRQGLLYPPSWLQTEELPEAAIRSISQKLAPGKREFIDIVTEDGVTGTQIPADLYPAQPAKIASPVPKARIAGLAQAFVDTPFNRPRAAQIFLAGNALFGGAYVLRWMHNEDADVNLEELIPPSGGALAGYDRSAAASSDSEE